MKPKLDVVGAVEGGTKTGKLTQEEAWRTYDNPPEGYRDEAATVVITIKTKVRYNKDNTPCGLGAMEDISATLNGQPIVIDDAINEETDWRQVWFQGDQGALLRVVEDDSSDIFVQYARW